MNELFTHDPCVADQLPQDRLAQYREQHRRRRIGPVPDGLAGYAGDDQMLDLGIAVTGPSGADHGPRVVLGLQQPRHDQRFPPSEYRRALFHLQQRPDPRLIRAVEHGLAEPAERARRTQRGVGLGRVLRGGDGPAGLQLAITDSEYPINLASCACVRPTASRCARNSAANACTPVTGPSSSFLFPGTSFSLLRVDHASRPAAAGL